MGEKLRGPQHPVHQPPGPCSPTHRAGSAARRAPGSPWELPVPLRIGSQPLWLFPQPPPICPARSSPNLLVAAAPGGVNLCFPRRAQQHAAGSGWFCCPSPLPVGLFCCSSPGLAGISADGIKRQAELFFAGERVKRVGEQKLLLPHKPCYGMGKCSSLQSRGEGEGQSSAAAAPRTALRRSCEHGCC